MAHRTIVAVAFAGIVLATAVFVAFFPQWWPAAAFLGLNGVGAVLYRYESRLPGWASGLLALLAERYPPITWWAKFEDIRMANTALLNDFELTLEEYGLAPLSEEDVKELGPRGRRLTIRRVAEHVAKREGGTIGSEALELLHRERSGVPTLNLWQSKKGNVMGTLAPILRRSERIPHPDRTYAFTDEDVRELMSALRDFDVDFLAQELRVLGALGQRLQRYGRFLRTEGLTKKEPHLTHLATGVREEAGLPSGPSTLFRLESAATTLRLMGRVDGFVQEGALRAVYRGIFLAERDAGPALLKEQCTIVSRWQKKPNPAEILHAYLWEKNRRAGAPLTLGELERGWSEWNSDAERELSGDPGGLEKELNLLRDRLDAGLWPIRRLDLEGEPKFPASVQVALSRHEEVRDLDGYLITFDERTGPVARLVDRLKELDPKRYRFGPYTRFTRLGLLPSDLPFHEFVERFFTDLDGVLRSYSLEPPLDPSPGGVVRVAEGQQRNVLLSHDGPCADEVEFTITRSPREGRLGPIQRMDSQRALVTYFTAEGSLGHAREVDFEYKSRCGDSTITRRVGLLVEPGQVLEVEPRAPVLHVVEGQPRNVPLRHDGSCVSGVSFRITRHPREGRLGPIQERDSQRALVTYFPADGPLRQAQTVDFEYASRCRDREKTHQVELLVEPKGLERPLDRIEVTVNRIDLAHCRELWFGDSDLGSVLRPPSIYDVWKAIKPHLQTDESPKVKEVFDRIAGGHGPP